MTAKANKAIQEEQIRQRKLEKQYKYLEGHVRNSEKLAKQADEVVQQRKKEVNEEISKQQNEGLVSKPKIIGRFKYSMRKTDFQLEDELAGSMREIKPLGQSELLRDRFDSVFRRNFVEPDAPTQFEKKRQRKAHFKWKERQTASMGGTVAEKRLKKLQKR